MKSSYFLSIILLFAFAANAALPALSQTNAEVFDKVELLVPKGDKIGEKGVRLHFLENELQIISTSNGTVMKSFKYAEIKDAEYSYSKNPRWKTGLGLGAAGLIFPPLLLIALPVAFSKHRRHWLTITAENDYAVLKLSKKNRKLILPAFETRTGVGVKGKGEDK